MGRGVWWGSAPRTAEGAKRRRSQGGYVGVAPPRRKGGSERYRHWLLPSLGDGEGGQLQWRSQKFVKGAGVRVQTVGRAAAAGRPMAQSAVGLNGGGGARRGCGFWWGSPSFVKGFGVIPRDSLPPTPGTVLPSYTPRYERRSFPPEPDYAECGTVSTSNKQSGAACHIGPTGAQAHTSPCR